MRLGNLAVSARFAAAGAAIAMLLVGSASAVAKAAIVGGASDRAAAAAYWMVASDGGVYSFGGASYEGSMLGHVLNAPIVGMAATPDGKGYWLVGGDGGIFNFRDAGFDGSMGGQKLNAAVVGMAGTPDGKGYWLVGADGGVFSFGDAGFYGAQAGKLSSNSIVGIVATPDGKGYRLLGSNEAAYPFGDAIPTAPTPTPTPRPPPPAPAPVSTRPVSTTIPRSHARRALNVRLTISWTWNRSVTRVDRMKVSSFPGRTRLVFVCRGRGCPRPRTAATTRALRLRRLLKSLQGRRYRSGDRLFISLTAPHYAPERAEVIIRYGRLPRVELLKR